MLLLLLSLAALAAGPVLIGWLHPRGAARAALDAFVLVGIAGLLLVHVLPHAVEAAGWPAAVAAAAGALLPTLLHRFYPEGIAPANAGGAVAGLAALATHAMLDGVALATPAESTSAALGVAVLMHRVPLSLGVWWLGLTSIGRRAAVVILATEGAGTVVGYSLGAEAASALSEGFLPVFQAFMAGTVLHVLFGHGPHRASDGTAPPAGDGRRVGARTPGDGGEPGAQNGGTAPPADGSNDVTEPAAGGWTERRASACVGVVAALACLAALALME